MLHKPHTTANKPVPFPLFIPAIPTYGELLGPKKYENVVTYVLTAPCASRTLNFEPRTLNPLAAHAPSFWCYLVLFGAVWRSLVLKFIFDRCRELAPLRRVPNIKIKAGYAG